MAATDGGDVTVDVSDLISRLNRFHGFLAGGLAPVLDAVADASAIRLGGGAYWRNHTGKTRDSVRITGGDGDGSFGRKVWVRAKWAEALDKGSRPHDIVAKRKRALAFVGAGGMTFRRKVRHPGTKAIDFSGQETAIVEARLPGAVATARDKAIDQAGIG